MGINNKVTSRNKRKYIATFSNIVLVSYWWLREWILASELANCEAYFTDCEVILQDSQSFAEHTFLIFDLLYFTDKQYYPLLEKYISSKNIKLIYKSCAK